MSTRRRELLTFLNNIFAEDRLKAAILLKDKPESHVLSHTRWLVERVTTMAGIGALINTIEGWRNSGNPLETDLNDYRANMLASMVKATSEIDLMQLAAQHAAACMAITYLEQVIGAPASEDR